MFERTLEIIDTHHLEIIKQTKVLLVGLGGVGGFVFESLVRLGFQNITIVDYDVFEKSNLNRQILCTEKTFNQNKIEVAKLRAQEINKEAQIITKNIFLTEENKQEINEKYDYIIDACDTISTKVLLIKKALTENTKIISCMGTGNRINPSLVTLTSLNKTSNDPLAKVLRKKLKENHLPLNIPVVWSKEIPIKKQNTNVIGSILLVPTIAGIYLTHFVLEDILKN